jgi:VCBS repeat-containing protein
VLRNDSAPSELEVAAVDGNTGDIGSPVTLDSGGELTLNADGSYTFDPRGAFDALTPADSATTTFTYTASDGVGGTAQATVTVGIDGVNDPPTLATNNTVTVSSTGGTESVSDADLSAQDPDDPDDALTFDVVSGPSNGTLRVGGSADTSFTQQDLANGRVSYEHDGSNTALDNIAFELSDDTADSLVTDTLEIVIGLSNQAPIARNDTDTTGEDAPLEVTDPANGVLGNDRDPDGDSLSVAAVNGASRSVGSQITLSSGALLTLDADGTYRYDPNDAYEVLAPGDDTTETFSYTAADGRGADNQATVTITVNGANDAPNLAANEGLSLDEGTTAPIPASALRASDVDDGPGALTYRVTTEPTQGRLLVAGSTATRFTQQALDSSRVAYEHTDSTAQNDEFAFSLTDDTGEGPSGQTFAIEVRVVNAPPTAASDRYVVDQGQTLTVSRPATGVLTNDQDPDGDALQASVASPPANGTLSLDPAGTFQYTPNSAFSGTDEFTYTAADGQGGTDDATVEVQVRPRRTSVSVTQSFPNPTQEQSFRLVALPGSADVSLASTLPGTQGEDWRAFREEGASDSQSFRQTNCADGPSCVLSPGTGYWLIARSAWSVADSIETVSLQPGSTATRPVYQIPLQDGWNALSNPLERDVSWGAVQAASGTNQSLYRWDEGWSTTQAFASAASGEAFYFRDDQIDTLTIPFPGLRQPPASSASPKRRTSAPTLRLHAVMGGDTLSTVQAGFQSGAEAGLGPADRYGPPSYFGTAALRLMRSDDGRPHALRVERRPPSREGTTFNVRLEAPPDSVVSIVAEGADAFPDDEVALVRRSNARTHNLRSTDVTLAPQSSTTAFRLAIGSSAYVEEVQKALAPDQVQLLPNYPNPFRRTTTLEYSLPERRSVRLAVYDVLGRRVQVLVDESQRAGFHRLRWDGRGNGGQPVASGVYFLRLTAGPAARTERLVVVR